MISYSANIAVAQEVFSELPIVNQVEVVSPTTQYFDVADDSSPYQTASTSGGFCGDVWEVSTRHLPCCINRNAVINPDLRVSHLENRRWVKRTLTDLLPDAPMSSADVQSSSINAQSFETVPSNHFSTLTIIYVHGNWMERDNARERVQIVSRAIARHADRPYRLIMLSWPSERDRGFVSDIRENAECADIQAHYLNYLLQHIDPSSQVSLLGFSFGARTVTGALHLAAGGSIDRLSGYVGMANTSIDSESRPHYRVSLVAPAVDRAWLQPGGRFELATSSIDWMVNLYNSKDPVLRRFRFLSRVSQPIAAGFVGFSNFTDPRATAPLTSTNLLEQYDCGSIVGNSHDEQNYYSKCPYFQKAVKNVLWLPVDVR